MPCGGLYFIAGGLYFLFPEVAVRIWNGAEEPRFGGWAAVAEV